MTTGPLHDDERHKLDEMERALRRDRRLERRMRRLGRRRRPLLARIAHYRPHPWTVAVLLVISVGLVAAGIATSEPAVIWAFAALWPVTLYAGFRLLRGWTEG
ncbi:DUF3040 domain-containing protein [Streptomyces sp. NPDC051001]|uniref:DUF3040 domain-containing protein n=1 Tax=Streptomyces sp. NPDC051001 TaxID=3155795 RepID=UPI00342BFDBA